MTTQANMLLPVQVKPYKFLRVFAGLLISLLIGVLLGVLFFYISNYGMYLIFLSPMLAGGAGGIASAITTHLTKVHKQLFAISCGLVMGITFYSAYRYAEYLDFRRVAQNEILESAIDPNMVDVNKTIAAFLKDEVGEAGFRGFIRYQAKVGMNVQDVYYSLVSDQNTALGTKSTLLLWLVDIIFIVGSPALGAYAIAKQPFCPETNEWLELKLIGAIWYNNIDSFMNAAKANQWDRARRLMAKDAPLPYFEVRLGRCHALSSTGLVKVVKVIKDGRGTTLRSPVLEQEISATDYELFLNNKRQTI